MDSRPRKRHGGRFEGQHRVPPAVWSPGFGRVKWGTADRTGEGQLYSVERHQAFSLSYVYSLFIRIPLDVQGWRTMLAPSSVDPNNTSRKAVYHSAASPVFIVERREDSQPHDKLPANSIPATTYHAGYEFTAHSQSRTRGMVPGLVQRRSPVGAQKHPLQCMSFVHCDIPSTLMFMWPQLFIPSALIYGLSDSIPFHLQICGPATKLMERIRPSSPKSDTKNHVRVHLMLRVSMFVCGERQHRNITIGEGVLSILPPPMCYSEKFGPHEACVDWAGVVQCDDSITVGSFDSGILCIKDFIVVSIPAWSVEHRHQVQFVSDTWLNDTGPLDRV
ncbi:hypothetical protein B0H12DRAFT_1269074 [Mycena haematopus]|nr:hypothetical protein B0H12DRAFT_1269074 [Mycena haematopus]